MRLPFVGRGSAANDHVGPFERVDCTKPNGVSKIIKHHENGTIYRLAALLSAVAEEQPQAAWAANIQNLDAVLEAARPRS